MDINDEIDMQDLKNKIKSLQEEKEELQVEIDILKEQLTTPVVGITLPTYKEANNETRQRIEDIKQTSSACANKDIHLGFELGFMECYQWIKEKE